MKQVNLLATVMIISSFFFIAIVNAQNSSIDYDLDEYKLPSLKRQELEFNFDLSDNLTKEKSQSDTNEYDKSGSHNFSANFSPHYSYYLNSEKYQFSQYSILNLPNYIESSSKTDVLEELEHHLSSLWIYNAQLREYISGLFFMEQDIDLRLQLTQSKDTWKEKISSGEVYSDRTWKSHYTDLQTSIPILIGWGRIERVEDARLAVYILDDLKKAGQLSRDVTKEDITKLAQKISEVLNERFFDSRKKEIRELEQIDSLLTDMGLIESENIGYYTLLNDNWDYASGSVRESGFRISGGISPELYYYQNNQNRDEQFYNPDSSYSDKIKNSTRELGIGGIFRVAYEKPVNLYWQFSVGNEFVISKNFFKNMYDTDGSSSRNKYNQINVKNQLYIGLGYFPNSRTTMNLSLSENIEYLKTDSENITGNPKNKGISSELSYSIYYYISPRIRLDVNSSVNYYHTKYESISTSVNKQTYFYGNASFIYKLL